MHTDFQQLRKLISDSKQILLVLGVEHSDDDIVSALALKNFLDKQQKQTEIACANFSSPNHLRFLTGLEMIKTHLSNLQKMTIKVDISKSKIESLSYEIKDDCLSIFLTPKQGIITKEDLRTAQSDYKFDLIISIGAQDLASIGNIFSYNTELFYKTPLINIDHKISNENFGQVNIIESTLSSNSETIYKILQQFEEFILDTKTANYLLTGMISATHSFKASNITPSTLNTAGKLMDSGADRETIIKHLYRTRSIAVLKLWGEALSHLQIDKHIGFAWTTLTRENFARSGARESDLKDIVAELIGNSPEAKIILIINEFKNNKEQNQIHGMLHVDQHFNAMSLLHIFNPQGNKKTASFIIENKSLKETEEIVVQSIRASLQK